MRPSLYLVRHGKSCHVTRRFYTPAGYGRGSRETPTLESFSLTTHWILLLIVLVDVNCYGCVECCAHKHSLTMHRHLPTLRTLHCEVWPHGRSLWKSHGSARVSDGVNTLPAVSRRLMLQHITHLPLLFLVGHGIINDR